MPATPAAPAAQQPPTGAAPPPLSRNRDFLLLWSGQWTAFFGTRMSAVCYPLLALWATGGSASAAGLVGFAALVPNLLLQLPAGVLADRWDRRKTMIGCGAGRLLALGSLAGALLAGTPRLAHLIAVVFVESAFAVVHQLAERGAVHALVPAEQLGAAMAQNEARGRAAGLLGAPAGTALFTVVRWGPFLTAAIGAVVAVVTLLFIRTPLQGARAAAPARPLAQIAEGFAWLRGRRFLRTAVGLVALGGGLFQILSLAVVVLLVRETGHSESVVGVVFAISGAGGLLGAVAARWWMERISLPALLIGGFAAWSLLIPVMALTTDPVLIGAAFALMNLVGAVFGVAASVYQMSTTPDEMQGRAGATSNLLVSGGASLGALGGGFLLDAWNASDSVLAVAAGMALLTLTAAALPAVRRGGDTPADAPADHLT
ncbi:MFS transporter [Streptomyces sp. NPDC057011]|uniref:MFS transporter n=1 Tax=unclassified Streptomyces TaxID=2593676 RepID=UPI00363D0922